MYGATGIRRVSVVPAKKSLVYEVGNEYWFERSV